MSTIDYETEASERYLATPARPMLQMGLRIGLWVAVAVGAVGGTIALLRPTEAAPAPVKDTSAEVSDLPAPVAGVAEIAVEEWLTASDENSARVAELFVHPPSLEGYDSTGLIVLRSRAVAGSQLHEGFWHVTVAVELLEDPTSDRVVADPGADDADADGHEHDSDTGSGPDSGLEDVGADPPDEDSASTTTTTVAGDVPEPTMIYFQIAIVGDVATRLQALAMPAVLPPPVDVPVGWQTAGPNVATVQGGDPVAAAVEGFLDGLLAGGSDPSRYLAPGVIMTPADPPPFTEIAVEAIGVQQMEDGLAWVRADVRVTTNADRVHRLAYDLVMASRAERWEVRVVTPVLGELTDDD